MVDDEPSVTEALAVILGEAGYDVVIADRIAQAMSILSNRSFNLVITDLRLADGTGIDLITHIKKATPDTEVILMTAYGSVDVTIEERHNDIILLARRFLDRFNQQYEKSIRPNADCRLQNCNRR